MGAVRTVSVALKMQVSDYVAGGTKAAATTKALGGELDTLAKTHKDKMADLTKVTLGVGGALAAVAGAAVMAAYTFDKQMSDVQAVSSASAKQMGQLRDAAIEAGKATQFSATDAAKAESELAKAGISTSDILGGALKGSLSLAAAGQMDLADAATISAQAMNIFGLKGSSVTHIADVLASASNASAADMQGLGDSLKQGGLIAAQTGLSLEDTVGVLSAFADNALVGSDAGTSLKTMLQALQAPSGKTADLMKQLGINAYDAQGNFIGITKFAGQLKAQLSGLTQAQRDNAMAQIFGSDATRAANILYKDGSAKIQDYIDKVNVSGAAAKTAAQKMDNLAGDVEQLKGSFETLAIESGGGVTKGLRGITEAANGVLGAVIDLPPALSGTLTVLSGVGGASLLAGVGFVKARNAGLDFMKTLTEMGPAGKSAATALGKIGSAGGKLGLIGIGAIGAYEGSKLFFDYVNKISGPAHANLQKLTDDLQAFAETGKVSGELAKISGGNLDAFADKLSSAIKKYQALQDVQASVARIAAANSGLSGSDIGAQYQSSVGEATKNLNQLLAGITDVDAGLAALVKNGDAANAFKVFNQLSQSMTDAGLPLDKINAEFPEYIKAAAGASQANGIAAKSTNLLTTAQGTLVLGMNDSITKGLALKDVINSLSGANEDAEKSTIAAQQALADISKQLQENAKAHIKNRTSLVDSTQAGRDNINMILSSIDADKQQFQSTYATKLQTEDQTSALKDATAQYDDYIARLRTTFTNEGFNKKQVDALIKAYGQIPPVATTTIKTPGMTQALASGSGLRSIMDNLDGRHVNTTVTTTYRTSGHPITANPNRWGGAYEHAADGLLRDASTYSPVNPGRYMIAEPQTGGEAFIPKRGDYGRSMSILGQAASWYGASVMAGGRGGGGGGGGGGAYSFNFYGPVGSRVELQNWLAGAMDDLRRKGRV